MNKRYQIFIIILAIVFAALMVSCAGTRSIEFLQEQYIIYLDEGAELTPQVYVRPKSSDYTITSSNTAVLEVLDGGKAVRAVYPDAAATITATSGELSVTAMVIIYRQRQTVVPIIPKETFTVYFDTDGRGGIAPQEVIPGGRAERPEGYEHQDNIIVGWFTDEEFENEYDFTSPVTEDITLYARWETGEATFQFVTREDGVYVRGLRYTSIEYDDIIIPQEDDVGNPVVGIDEQAFYRASTGSKTNIVKFTSVVIPSTVKVIGKEAFTGITTLTAVYFDGDSELTTIGDSAFQNCNELTDLTLPNGLTTIGASAFSGAKKLNITSLPAGLSVLSENAFNSTATESVDLKNVTHIKQQAFYGSRVTTILNSGKLEQLGKNAFLNTPWWLAKRQAGGGADKPIYLHDNILVAYHTTSPSKAFDITVSVNTRLIADAVFENVTRGTIRFITLNPPKFGSYVFNAESVVVVPLAARETYAEALTTFRYKLYSVETVLDHLEIFVNAYTAAHPQRVEVIINKYKSESVPTEYAQRLDIKTALYDMFPERKAAINIQRIKTSAFYNISNLATVVLPPRIYNVDINAFNHLPVFGRLRIEGEYGENYTPKGTTVTVASSAINPILSQDRDYFIEVPESKLKEYKESPTTSWGRYASKIQGYTP
ncbi:MAG: leucine-rich repeat protein [Clostridia bacterium]